MTTQYESSFDSGAHHGSASSGLASAIAFDSIEKNDKLLIKTLNSEYRFEVDDPVSHRGMLSGGTLGRQPREAILIESFLKSDSGSLQDFQGLKTGARALFYLASTDRVERVTTSKISSIRLVKAADRSSLIEQP